MSIYLNWSLGLGLGLGLMMTGYVMVKECYMLQGRSMVKPNRNCILDYKFSLFHLVITFHVIVC